MRSLKLKPINYEFTVSFLRDCQEIAHDTVATKKECIESHINWCLMQGGNTIVLNHATKPKIKLHIIKDNVVWIESFNKTGDNMTVTNKIDVAGFKIFDLFGETENEEWNCEHLPSVLVG